MVLLFVRVEHVHTRESQEYTQKEKACAHLLAWHVALLLCSSTYFVTVVHGADVTFIPS